MGTLDHLAGHLKEATLRNGTRILVAASRANIEVLSSAANAAILPTLRVAMVEPQDMRRDIFLAQQD